MVDVFISYSRKDQAMVAMLARAVEGEGYDVWWDADLPPHKSYGEVITENIARAKAAIVVWSADAVQSEWVRAEADMARNQRKLVQTALDHVVPPLPFNQIQYAELGDWRGEADHPGWRKVKVSLADLCGPGGEGRPVPPTLPSLSAPSPGGAPPAPSAARATHWPLFAGIAIAVVGLAAAGAMWLGQRTPVSISAATPTASSAPVIAAASLSQSVAPAAPAPAPVAPPVAAPPAPAAPIAVPLERVSPPGEGDVALAPNPSDLTFPDASTRLLSPAEVATLGPATLRLARNEIYARKGRRFRDPWLRNYFSRFAWYRPRFDEVPLNPVERRNVALLQQAEARYR